MNYEGEISIPEFFAGQKIFITGGTGLMGKVLIEKIMRSCPDVANIFLLIRPQRNLTIEERWSKITNIPLFEKLKSERPESFQKIILLPGDIGKQNLGLSDTHIELLLENVTLMYHAAAMILFTDSMGKALEENVKGTWHVLELAKRMKKLKIFVHTSTAYSQVNKRPEEASEDVFPACQDWKVMLKILETQPLHLELLREKLLCGHPNSYTWSKSLAEDVVNGYCNYFPIIIIRPSIVCSALEDPIPGWIDAKNGFSVMAYGVICGVVRVLPTKPEAIFDFVPVDVAIKACIIAPWKHHTSLKQTRENIMAAEVYNCATGNIYLATNNDLELYSWELNEKYPTENQVWVKSVVYTTNNAMLRISILFRQVLPAAVVDLVLYLLGKETLALKLTKKMVNAFRYFNSGFGKRIMFPNEKFVDLGKELKEQDKAAFSYTFNPEEKKEIINQQTIGLRKYLYKEDFSDDAMRRNRKRFERIKLVHKAVTSATYLAVGYIFLSYCRAHIL